MPLNGDARPMPKDAQLARGQRRYRRKIASPKQWQAIIAAKTGVCRVCCSPHTRKGWEGWDASVVFHHVVARDHFGDDTADNIIPLCRGCHATVHRFPGAPSSKRLLASLTDAEYAYAVERGGEDYFERAYGLRYSRGTL